MKSNKGKAGAYKTSPARKRIMASIRSSNTRPELAVRRLLFKHGYRYRLHGKGLPGKPDIILPKYNVVIFVNGCFWHYHGCKFSHLPKNNAAFWQAKIKANLQRDKKNVDELLKLGWRVLIIWECAIAGPTALTENSLLEPLIIFLKGSQKKMGIAA